MEDVRGSKLVHMQETITHWRHLQGCSENLTISVPRNVDNQDFGGDHACQRHESALVAVDQRKTVAEAGMTDEEHGDHAEHDSKSCLVACPPFCPVDGRDAAHDTGCKSDQSQNDRGVAYVGDMGELRQYREEEDEGGELDDRGDEFAPMGVCEVGIHDNSNIGQSIHVWLDHDTV